MSLRDKTILITGGSRGIGREIALRCARDGARIVLAAKTDTENPTLPGTIHSVAAEVEHAGGKALALKVDVRNDAEIEAMVEKAASHFGGLDALINNAGAISLTPTLQTPMKKYDLMQQINVRATFACSRAAIPHLVKSSLGQIISLSPPIRLETKWLAPHFPYTLSKYGMTMCMLGLAEEFKGKGVSATSLWPTKIIATAAIQMLLGEKGMTAARRPEIVAEAAYAILAAPKGKYTGRAVYDEEVLQDLGKTDFESYNVDPKREPMPDLFVEPVR